MSMIAFNNAILLVGVRARNKVRDSKRVEKFGEGLKLPTTVGLQCTNFSVKYKFNITFEKDEDINNI